MFDWIPLIGEWPFWQQALLLLAIPIVTGSVGWALITRYEGSTSVFGEIGGLLTLLSFPLAGLLVAVFLGSSVAAIIPDSDPPEPVTASSVSLEGRDYDRKIITVKCPESSNVGKVELLGRVDATSFRVEAIRMRAGGDQSDLSVDIGFMIYERQIYRSPTPQIVVEGLRGDGEWQSRYLDTTLILTRGGEFLMNAGLGTAPESVGWPSRVRNIEQECRGLMVAF